MSADTPKAEKPSNGHVVEEPQQRGPIAWMASNPVAANLAMIMLLVGGLLGLWSAKQEVFPDVELDMIQIEVPYPGASPDEVEQGVLLAIEEGVSGLEGVKHVNSTAYEGRGTVSIELQVGADPDKVLTDAKGAVDRITTFPQDAEDPRVSLAFRQNVVVSLMIAGDMELADLHAIAEKARFELLRRPDITKVALVGVPPLEISIEVPRRNLETYGLSLDQIAAEVRAASIDLPAGAIKTAEGEILVRTTERKRAAHEFENLPIRGTADGSEVTLGEIAEIRDGYEDRDLELYYNGQRAIRLTIYRVGSETPRSVAAGVREYLKELRPQLPPGVTLEIWDDDSEVLDDRIDLLLRNAAAGLVLVLVILALFLELRLALWVSLGIPVSFLGAFLVLGNTSFSVNMISLFAFIVTLGMVVDDAIVVSEHAYTKVQGGMSPHAASIEAAKEMVTPVTFAILTTVAAFSPLFFVPGSQGKLWAAIPTVVVSVLIISLLESFLVLPAHLAHTRFDADTTKERAAGFYPLRALQGLVAAALEFFARRMLAPVLGLMATFRYIAVAGGIAILVVVVGFVGSGAVPFNFFPPVEADVVTVTARFPFGVNVEDTRQLRATLEQAAHEAADDLGEPGIIKQTFTMVGQEVPAGGPNATAPESGGHIVSIQIELGKPDTRTASSAQFADAWKKHTPKIPGLESISYSASLGVSAGAAVQVQISHPDTAVLAKASMALAEALDSYPDLINVRNEYAAGKPQLDFTLRQEARQLGFTATEVARQIRASFYGSEARRDQRGRNELKIMVRLPKEERIREYDIEELAVRAPQGGLVPLASIADFSRGRSATSILREDGARKVSVSAELAEGVKSPQEVLRSLETEVLPAMREKYPGIELSFAGSQRSQQETFASLGRNFIFALFVIYALLAVPFRSYVQPIVVMAVIPFGLIGAVGGHVLLNYSLSIMSVMGMVALSGVVINDSIVLIDAANGRRAAGDEPRDAIIEASLSRLRPILLTSLTTFFGLAPMLLETSVQARFLIPMAISLAFGILVSTVVVLTLIPAVYLIVEDLIFQSNRLKRGLVPRRRPQFSAAVSGSSLETPAEARGDDELDG